MLGAAVVLCFVAFELTEGLWELAAVVVIAAAFRLAIWRFAEPS